MIQEAVYFFEFFRDGGPAIPQIRIRTYVDPIENRRWWNSVRDESLKPLNYKGVGYSKNIPAKQLHVEKVTSSDPNVKYQYHILYYLLDVKEYAFAVYKEFENSNSVHFHAYLLDKIYEGKDEGSLKKGDYFHVIGTGLQKYPGYKDDMLTVESVSFSQKDNPAYDDNIGEGAPMYSADNGKVNVYEWECEYIDPRDIEFGIDPWALYNEH